MDTHFESAGGLVPGDPVRRIRCLPADPPDATAEVVVKEKDAVASHDELTAVDHGSPSASVNDGDELPPGTRVDNYIITETIGRGGMAYVYSAVHVILERRVAIKVLLRKYLGCATLQRFIREAQVVNRIRHPNIVDIYDFGCLADMRPYFVMELLEGRSLHVACKGSGPMSTREVLSYLEPICAGLAAAHAGGVVHRDLKASNIIVPNDGRSAGLKLLDFGIAKILQPEPWETNLTAKGCRLGTSHAMAPEQIRGEAVDVRTDVYALGVLIFRLLTQSYPFSGAGEEIERQHLYVPAPRPGQLVPVSPALDALVAQCLEKEPDRRPGTVREVFDRFREAVEGASPHSADREPSHRALGIYLEVRPNEGVDVGAAMLPLSECLDSAEQLLLEAGFLVALQTSNALLGVAPIVELRDAALSAASAVAVARRLSTLGEQDLLSLRVSVHADDVHLRKDGAPIDGPLLQLATWPAALDTESRDSADVGISASVLALG